MGRTANAKVEAVLRQHANGQSDLLQAWTDAGKPGSWGNLQRRAKAMKAATTDAAVSVAAAPAAAVPPTAPRAKAAAKGGGSKRRATGASSSRQPKTGKVTLRTTHFGPCADGCRERQPERFGPCPGSQNALVRRTTRLDSASIMPVPNLRVAKYRRVVDLRGTRGRYGEIEKSGRRAPWSPS